jgi:hypothetical protein
MTPIELYQFGVIFLLPVYSDVQRLTKNFKNSVEKIWKGIKGILHSQTTGKSCSEERKLSVSKINSKIFSKHWKK